MAALLATTENTSNEGLLPSTGARCSSPEGATPKGHVFLPLVRALARQAAAEAWAQAMNPNTENT